jgi:hypothetical protein
MVVCHLRTEIRLIICKYKVNEQKKGATLHNKSSHASLRVDVDGWRYKMPWPSLLSSFMNC